MRYKKLHNKSIPKKYLHKKSKSKIVGTRKIITYIPDSLDKQKSIDFITSFNKNPVTTIDGDITFKKSRFDDFINNIDRKKVINYSLFLLVFTGVVSYLTINYANDTKLTDTTNPADIAMTEEITTTSKRK